MPTKNQEAKEVEVQGFEEQGLQEQGFKEQRFAFTRLLSFEKMVRPPVVSGRGASVFFDAILIILRQFVIMPQLGNHHGR